MDSWASFGIFQTSSLFNVHKCKPEKMSSSFCITVCILYCFTIRTSVITAHSANPIPYGWENMCSSSVDPDILGLYVDNVTSVGHMISMQCHVTEEMGAKWKFQTFRNWLHNIPDTSVFLQVKCSNKGRLSMPWPMKAYGLVGLKITNCFLTDKYSDFNNPDVSKIPDQLRVLDVRDSIWLSDGSGFDKITSPEGLSRLTSDYDCGQDSTIEYMVNSNVSDMLLSEAGISGKNGKPKVPAPGQGVAGELDIELQKILDSSSSSSSSTSSSSSDSSSDSALANVYDQTGTMDNGKDKVTIAPKPAAPLDSPKLDGITFINMNFSLNSTGSSAADEYLKLLKDLQSLDLKCNYDKLRVLDESFPPFLPFHHFELMLKGATYPELRIMNYSYSGMNRIPQELQDFRKYFPKLEYLDLSNNRLSEIHLSSYPRKAGEGFLTLDARYNQITEFSVEDLIKWSKIDGVFIDIRHNPIHCGCHMEQLFSAIKSNTFFKRELAKYDYVRDMECASPRLLKGQKLSKMNIKCTTANYAAAESPSTEDNPEVTSSPMIGLIIGCSILALIIVGVVVFVVVKIRFGDLGSNKLKKKPVEAVEAPNTTTEKNAETVFNQEDEVSGKE